MVRVDLGPVTEVRRTMKGQEKEKRGRSLKILDVVESELSKLKLRFIMGLMELLIG